MTNTDSTDKSYKGKPVKAMLLAAGRGERMRPLTDETAKPLLKVNGKSLIVYHLEKLASAGVEQVVINTSWQAEKIVSDLGNGSDFNLEIQYSHEPQALETAGGIRKALALLGDDPFIVISADVWCDVNYGDFIKGTQGINQKTTHSHLLMVRNPPHHQNGDFAISNTQLLQIPTAGANQHSDLPTYTYSGIGMYSPDLFKSLAISRCRLLEVLIPAIRKNAISAQVHTGEWFDVGTIDRLNALEHFLQRAG